MKNAAASINAKLKAEARKKKVSTDFILMRYANERLLGRLSCTKWKDKFCVKGSMLLPVWNEGHMFRPTADVDLNGIGDGDLSTLLQAIEEISDLKPASQGGTMDFDDGLVFDKSSIRSKFEREGGTDGGKVEFNVFLDKSRIHMKVDVGFNYPVTPTIVTGEYPCLLSEDKKAPLPKPVVQMYPPETTISEKLHAIVFFGGFNTRTRDYFDLYTLFQQFDFSDEILGGAIEKTFRHQGTALPEFDEMPGLSVEYAIENQGKWTGFNKTTNLAGNTPKFTDVMQYIRDRIQVPLELAKREETQPALAV